MTLPPDQRVEEFTKLIIYDSIKGLCLKNGLSVTSKIARIGQDIVGSIIRNKPLAKNLIRATKTYLDLLKRYPQEVAHRALTALKQNPSLVEEPRDLGKAAKEIAKIDADLARLYKKTIEGKGFTGRIKPTTLKEQLAMKEVLTNPLTEAKELKAITMTDQRWPAQDGWVKMAKNVNGIEIHFLYNTKTGLFDDFKFKS